MVGLDGSTTIAPPGGAPGSGPESQSATGRRRLRRRAVKPVAAGAALALAAGAVWAVADSRGDSAGAARREPSTTTATVTKRNLVARDTFAGSLGFADSRALASGLAGTITGIRREGEVVRRGGILYRVNGRPVVLLYGWYPLWRAIDYRVEGQDVRQLERNLVALGYDPDGDIEVDEEYDWATRAAVKRWQADLGVTADGVVEPGDAVFLPGPRRVGEVKAQVGSTVQTGASVMDTSATTRIVTVDLDARRQTLVAKGQTVTVELPSGRVVEGIVTNVGKVAKTSAGDDDSTPTIEVTIALRNARAAGSLDQAPVDVGIAREYRRSVLTVPVTALLALAGGGYAVEVVEGGRTRLVRVEPGLYAGGLVEISGKGIREGMKVAVPR